MWSVVVVEYLTTSNSVRWNLAVKLGLIVWLGAVPTSGVELLIFFRTIVPCVLQPYRFVPLTPVLQTLPLLFGVQPVLKHFAEWSFSAIHLPIEKGKMVFGPARAGLTPSFSSMVPLPSETQEPGVIAVPLPSAVRKNDRVPDPVWGRNALIGALAPPTWLQLVMVHS